MQLCVNSEGNYFEGNHSWFPEFVKQSYRHSLVFVCVFFCVFVVVVCCCCCCWTSYVSNLSKLQT
jgi:hypothetical protein